MHHSTGIKNRYDCSARRVVKQRLKAAGLMQIAGLPDRIDPSIILHSSTYKFFNSSMTFFNKQDEAFMELSLVSPFFLKAP